MIVEITINGTRYKAEEGTTIVAAAAANGVYVPTLCHHPDLPPFANLPLASRVFRGEQRFENQAATEEELRGLQGCGLCMVEVEGSPEPVRACQTRVAGDMSICTENEALRELRRTNLMKILAIHPHACLTCAQREGCSLEDCSSNVPKEERCCWRFHDCELRKVAEYVGIKEETPRFRPAGLPVLDDEPLFARDFNVCIDCTRCVRACNQVRGVQALGVVHHDGRLVVGSVGPSLIASACKFCGACVEVCPTGCLRDKDLPAGDREQALVPCIQACPAGADVPGYIRRIAEGDFRGAAALIWEKLPLPNVLGHICFHLCEYECRRGKVDEPIAICALKRFALETDDGTLLAEAAKLSESGRRVAVIGAGPAGLAAAYFLRFKGHGVTIFEAAESPGGMPMVSIPDYRLPREVLERDLAAIRRLGVEIKTGCRLAGENEMLGVLDEGFGAVLVAVGLPESKRIDIKGGDLDGVLWGLEFLSAVKAGKTFALGRQVIVIGGGNVAIDVAMTALRLSGGAVRLFCLEGRQEMPAFAHEIEKAEAEGIEINPSWGPASILGDSGRVTGVEFRRCVAVFDEQRKFAPEFDEQQRKQAAADSVIFAIGQAPAEGMPREQDGVFLAGDITGGSMSVVHAVASGRSAAERIDRYLGGDGQISLQLGDHGPPNAWIGREQGFAPRGRVPIPCAGTDERRSSFCQIEATYSKENAVAEARRCLQCDLRLQLTRPGLPPEKWLEFSRSNVERVPTVEGVIILAGADRKPTLIKGAANAQAELLERLESGAEARFFLYEEDRMYSKRESELIQQHLKQYGELPGGGDDELEDLF
jgi:formate dehydrogenase beta subunit